MRRVRIVGENRNVSLSYVAFMQDTCRFWFMVVVIRRWIYGCVLRNGTYKFYIVEVYNVVNSQGKWAIYWDKQDKKIWTFMMENNIKVNLNWIIYKLHRVRTKSNGTLSGKVTGSRVTLCQTVPFVLMLTDLSDQTFDQPFFEFRLMFFLAAVGIFHTHTQASRLSSMMSFSET